MNGRGDDSFRRLLRWYPIWWRVANGEVLLGTLRDQAEYENRTGPSRQEVLSAVINGLGTRLDARFALWSSVGAILLSAASWSLLMFGLSSIPGAGGWIGIITTGVAPALTLAGLIALIRFRGWVGAARALLVLGVLTGALVLAAFAQLSWAQGFQLADAGLPQSGLAAVWGPLVVGGFILGAAGLGILLDGQERECGSESNTNGAA